jgi:hypothetical protein
VGAAASVSLRALPGAPASRAVRSSESVPWLVSGGVGAVAGVAGTGAAVPLVVPLDGVGAGPGEGEVAPTDSTVSVGVLPLLALLPVA